MHSRSVKQSFSVGKFFKDVRKQNGGEYEPDSISSF